jgi:hypothetical protein
MSDSHTYSGTHLFRFPIRASKRLRFHLALLMDSIFYAQNWLLYTAVRICSMPCLKNDSWHAFSIKLRWSSVLCEFSMSHENFISTDAFLRWNVHKLMSLVELVPKHQPQWACRVPTRYAVTSLKGGLIADMKRPPTLAFSSTSTRLSRAIRYQVRIQIFSSIPVNM